MKTVILTGGMGSGKSAVCRASSVDFACGHMNSSADIKANRFGLDIHPIQHERSVS